MVFKCKMCGGALEIKPDVTIVRCSYCDTPQTIPRLSDERRANLYDRAGHFRRNNEFDKAAGIYETILAEDPNDAEAYWSLVLCRYGIEYVTDPATRRRLPTVNRTQYTSIFDDENYKAALANADSHRRELYEAEAEAINNIQKGILAISQKEEPFDVFVCYKETDQSGRRTHDSVLAQELYYQLKQEGFRVFFSRITLEDKLGAAYEPYIFAALQSAKVMVVLGTTPAYFNAVWVKNEWSRYLSLIKNGANKVLIPAYRDMDPYDLPDEFSHLQAQDMSKLGFMQDLVRGIKKIVGATAQKTAPVQSTVPVAQAMPVNVKPMMERVFLLLEDGDFEKADGLCEQVLNQDPQNAEAYLAKLLIELGVNTAAQLVTCGNDFTQNANYAKIMRFGSNKIKQELEGYVKQAAERYQRMIEEENLRRQKEADEALEWQLNQAMRDIDATENPVYALDDAQNLLKRLKSYSNKPFAVALIPVCEQKIARLEEACRIAEEQKRLKAKRQKKIMLITVCALLVVALLTGLSFLIYNAVTYETVDGIEYVKKDDGYHILSVDPNLSGDVVIPAEIDGVPVVAIPQGAFLRRSITSITIPASVTSIGNSAFYYCSQLTTITFGANSKLTSIGPSAFYGCSQLTTVTFGANSKLTSIGPSAFYSCYSLTTVTFGANSKLTSIGAAAFDNCSKLTTVTFGKNSKLTSIGSHAFSSCDSLTTITIPASVTSIGEEAFSNCSKLTTVTFGANSKLTSIGSHAFSSCDSLTTITIPDSVTSIGEEAFSNCSKLTTVTFGANSKLTSIGEAAFYSCDSLITITIPEGVTSIGISAFAGCSKLITVYYGGKASDWGEIEIGSSNSNFKLAFCYYYSATEPTTAGNWWHYDQNGKPVIWP